MVKVLLVFGSPKDLADFDRYFSEHHRPLLLRLPDLQHLTEDRVAGAAKGETPFHLIVSLAFDSEDAMQEALVSEPGLAMARDFGNFASGGVSVLFAHSTAAVAAHGESN
jgi:uncharacterized protein (TIGR02118 family)